MNAQHIVARIWATANVRVTSIPVQIAIAILEEVNRRAEAMEVPFGSHDLALEQVLEELRK